MNDIRLSGSLSGIPIHLIPIDEKHEEQINLNKMGVKQNESDSTTGTRSIQKTLYEVMTETK